MPKPFKHTYPPGHLCHGDPKTPSMNAVWQMLKADYGVERPSIKERIKNGESAEVWDYDRVKKGFPVIVHVPGAAYPSKYLFDAEPEPMIDADSYGEAEEEFSERPRG